MVSKTRKFRGSRTHGRGRKHGRGAGDRGGTGNAGLHKHKFKWMLKYDPDHFGAHGFVRHHDGEKEIVALDLEALEIRLPAFLKEGVAAQAGGSISVDLGKAGVDKLLGSGRVTRPMKITVARATDQAKARVTAAGGSVDIGEGV